MLSRVFALWEGYGKIMRMKRWILSGFWLFLFALRGWASDFEVDLYVTERLKAMDQGFIEAFEVYLAGTKENPLVLLFDPKGDPYSIASSLWAEPLKGKEVLYILRRLEERSRENLTLYPMPQALKIVNRKGEVVGYIYGLLRYVPLEKSSDGRVKVFLPDVFPWRGFPLIFPLWPDP